MIDLEQFEYRLALAKCSVISNIGIVVSFIRNDVPELLREYKELKYRMEDLEK